MPDIKISTRAVQSCLEQFLKHGKGNALVFTPSPAGLLKHLSRCWNDRLIVQTNRAVRLAGGRVVYVMRYTGPNCADSIQCKKVIIYNPVKANMWTCAVKIESA